MAEEQQKMPLKEKLHTAFLIIAITSFSLGIAINVITLKKLSK